MIKKKQALDPALVLCRAVKTGHPTQPGSARDGLTT